MKLILVLLISVKLNYVTSSDTVPTRAIHVVMADVDKALVDLFSNNGNLKRGAYALKFLKSYDGLLDQITDMVNNNQKTGWKAVKCIKLNHGPLFFQIMKNVLVYKSQFKWADKHVELFTELIYEIVRKWMFLKDSYEEKFENN